MLSVIITKVFIVSFCVKVFSCQEVDVIFFLLKCFNAVICQVVNEIFSIIIFIVTTQLPAIWTNFKKGSWPCLMAVSMTDRKMAKVSAPSMVRN